jgi:CheY-like chemotaxis protein
LRGSVRSYALDAVMGWAPGRLGDEAIEADDGVSGLRVLQSGVRVDLLITDVGLPGGLDGRQMADAAREVRPALKVLFVTGYAESAAIGSGHPEPGMHVLTKPFAMETLASRIKSIIAGTTGDLRSSGALKDIRAEHC